MTIRTDRDGAVWTLTLDRPDKANALTKAMLEELRVGVTGAAEAGARGLILTGAGRVFSAGMDLAEADTGLPTDPLWDALSDAVAAFSGVSVAALNGTVAGGALGMVLACDLRIAVLGTRLFYPVIGAGYLPQPADPPRLAALVGPARARRMLLLGERVELDDALTWGLVDRRADGDVVAAARNWIAPAIDSRPGLAEAIKARL
ncbi:enoyl-CoA hydratase/isomerase family protein [Wenxinia marina]|uniref:Enoyl-CoA hydratase/carnithine racemase n=1 Tax=Wenxinia marina DSM 24838 TaxID=1123501 RepID=A0A0D0Q7G2_9RHOB|nr:enoyl-CoA hydratase/isomerase family protein [Wenxinia marina]KIQ70384.1 Enoyl-CoA hydratase/carnithine racemase [Wenxinia marina DSM 24838]GGL53602.1 enoyl-CoA hydratase [Wenxinia marina]